MLKQYRIKFVAAIVAVVLSSIGAGGQGWPAQSREARQIRAVLDRQVAAWNRRDLEGFMSAYWRSPDLSFYSGGTRVAGWQPTLDRYRQRYQGEGREMGELAFSEIKIEMLGPRAAFVRGRFRLKMAASEPSGIFTLVFRKLGREWKIVHDHTSS